MSRVGDASALLGSLLLAWALVACQRPSDAAAIPHTPIPKAEPRLALTARDGRIRYEGVVADAAARAAITAALSATPGANGTLTVEPRTREAAWTGGLGQAAAALAGIDAARLDFEGRRVALSGDGLSQEQRATLLRRIQRLYPGYEYAGGFAGVDMRQALPDRGDATALLAFLDAAPIAFHPGTGLLTPASVDALARIARGMKAAGPSARVEIRVHAGAGAGEAAGRDLMRQRADALVTQLAMRGVPPNQFHVMPAAGGEGADGAIEFAPLPAGDAGTQLKDMAPADGTDEAPTIPADPSAAAPRPPASGD